MQIQLPEQYTCTRRDGVLVLATAAARDFALEALAGVGSLFRFAASHAEASRLEGRGPVYAIPAAGGRWVVRHSRRGGAIARWLDDRYLAVGVPRPVAELLTSDAARRRGVDTPEIQAVLVYSTGAFYRADIATAHIPDSTDLAGVLFGDEAAIEVRTEACEAAGRLIRDMTERGIVHADLNVKNILLSRASRPPRPYVLDLDRCQVVARVSGRQRDAMLRRFWRSVRKWEARTARSLTAAERSAFNAAYAS